MPAAMATVTSIPTMAAWCRDGGGATYFDLSSKLGGENANERWERQESIAWLASWIRENSVQCRQPPPLAVAVFFPIVVELPPSASAAAAAAYQHLETFHSALRRLSLPNSSVRPQCQHHLKKQAELRVSTRNWSLVSRSISALELGCGWGASKRDANV